eukprot:359045-Chlamydomonas_euryale.AAC.1
MHADPTSVHMSTPAVSPLFNLPVKVPMRAYPRDLRGEPDCQLDFTTGQAARCRCGDRGHGQGVQGLRSEALCGRC